MWKTPSQELPDEEVLVVVQVKGNERRDYYRIEGRWYYLADLNQWTMNRSRYWPDDRTWYVKTESIEAWHYQTITQAGKKKRKRKKR